MGPLISNILIILALVLAIVFMVHPGPIILLAVSIVLICAALLSRKG